uniref:Kinesin motor domain-containing protein n=1 Tax=Fagus sylvatica TaxID=28930 RepID=A0A2N9EIC7_FAGSY
MSKETSSSRIVARNVSKNNTQHEANENEFETSLNPIHFPPPRTPLNTIQDPSQSQPQKDFNDPDFDSHHKLEAVRSTRISDKKLEAPDRVGNASHSYVTPRVSARAGTKPQSEPNSAQSTPAKSVSRHSIGGGTGGCALSSRACSLYNGGRGGSSSRVSRGISNVSVANCEFPVEVQHFELIQDPSFWTDHSVQVLIRIRPLSAMERVSQGFGLCLKQESAQTLVWLGHPETRFTFDHIACETISQENLFRVAGLPMVENCMSGYNSCMFAYGQTGSGKTYTMMGEIYEMEGMLSEDCGITPRIFEYLFSRIRAEEESRRDEKLKYSCKCSFLEIYNEQITDLLEPSSTNLQLREDLKKGVYVENLTEHNVRTVNDVVKLLLQGAANRKMAATHMNSESSRSHSVFTCIIESCWEKDSMTHFRFARLNLVDLAGSERQKSSGAEGDRLKEAANINKSLSTLGLVIMSLVDLAHGKHRHVPYRDSRLTFLLQDSLGGNSKTTIIANVSPSMCSANETLSTLKFAQRAKLIQNNAKVNEDASGDVTALQRQIQQLKGQLSILKKHNNLTSSMSSCIPPLEESELNHLSEGYDSLGERKPTGNHKIHSLQSRKMRCMQATLVGALRREKMAETAVRKLEAEIEQVNHLACQREEDAQHTKMMLRFREEKIKQLELLVHSKLSSEKYLMEENKALLEEIQLVRARTDRNPELTRFALENIRLHEQLQLFQKFYEQGERETLLSEVSELRNQLLEALEGKLTSSARNDNQDNCTIKELEDCRNMNFKLIREVDELRTELRKYLNCSQAASDSVTDSFSRDPEEFRQTDNYSLEENISIQSDSVDDTASCTQTDDGALQNRIDQNMGDSATQPDYPQKELTDARLLIKAMESEQVHLITELQHTQEENKKLMEMLSNKDKEDRQSVPELQSHILTSGDFETCNMGLLMEGNVDIDRMDLEAKLDKMTRDLEEVRSLNNQYQEDRAFQLSEQHQTELVCEQVEMETSRTILQLQEDVTALQLELHERLCYMTQDNTRLRNTIAAKDEEIKALCMEWERATLELTSFLVDGSKSLKDASGQIEGIAGSFPQASCCISEHVKRAASVCMEKEESILLLEKSLEDAQRMVIEMELKLNSLKEATMALNEFQQLDTDESTDEEIHLSILSSENTNMLKMQESKCKIKKDQVTEAEKFANAALLKDSHRNDIEKDIPIPKLDNPTDVGNHKLSGMKADTNVLALEDIKAQLNLARLGVLESENAISECYMDLEMHIAALQNDVCNVSSAYRESVQELVKEIHEMRKIYMELRENHKSSKFCTVESLSMKPHKFLKFEKQDHMLNQIRDKLAETNDVLNLIKDCIKTKVNVFECLSSDEDLIEAEAWSVDCSLSGSEFSTESVASGIKMDDISYTCHSRFPAGTNMTDLKVGGSVVLYDDQESEKSRELLKASNAQNEATRSGLRKELEMAFHAFSKLYVQLAALLSESDVGDCSYPQELIHVPCIGLGREKAEADCYNTREVVADQKTKHASSFLTKFEEAHATMREADLMLNALLKANESAKHLTGKWKQAGEDLMVERASLIEEVAQLKSSIRLKEVENELLQDQIRYGLAEIANSLSLLEVCFLQMQKVVDERFNMIYSDAVSMGQEMLYLVSNSRSSLEDICAEIMAKELALFVLYRCHVGEFISKLPYFNAHRGLYPFRHQECCPVKNSQTICSSGNVMVTGERVMEEGDESEVVRKLEEEELGSFGDNLIYENLALKKELKRKEVLLEGLLFDFSLLQESASNTMDIKDETEKLIFSLSQVRQELEMKTSQLDELLVEYRKLEGHLADTEKAFFISNSDLEQAKETIHSYSDQNDELKVLLKDLYLKKCETEEQLDEQKQVVKGLEKEILHLTSSAEKRSLSLVKGIEDDLRRVISERDQLCEEVQSLNDKLEMAYALADEKEAIAVEARQESEASKVYAEQKEEEVKILEHSVEELECTINVLEKKASIDQRFAGTGTPIFETERLASVENFTENVDSGIGNSEHAEEHISRIKLTIKRVLTLSMLEQICMLNTRLAAAESMTHDVIRDLLGVKLDMTNYANLIDQCQVQKLVGEAHQQTEEFQAKEQEIHNLRKRINDLLEERESCISEIKKKETDIFTVQVTVEQLQERDQLLSAQNEMLKMDKANLKRRVTELDEMVKSLLKAPSMQQQTQPSSKSRDNSSLKLGGADFTKRLAHSEKLLSRVNDEIAQYRRSSGSYPNDKTYGQGIRNKR